MKVIYDLGQHLNVLTQYHLTNKSAHMFVQGRWSTLSRSDRAICSQDVRPEQEAVSWRDSSTKAGLLLFAPIVKMTEAVRVIEVIDAF